MSAVGGPRKGIFEVLVTADGLKVSYQKELVMLDESGGRGEASRGGLPSTRFGSSEGAALRREGVRNPSRR